MTIMKNRIISAFLISSLALGACTDLSETLYDKVSMDEYGQTPAEVKTIVSGAYSTLRGFDSSNGGVNCYPCSEYVFFMLECASDEAAFPPAIPVTGTMPGNIAKYNITNGPPTAHWCCHYGTMPSRVSAM